VRRLHYAWQELGDTVMNKLFVGIGLLQGLLLLFLTEGIKHRWQVVSLPEFSFPAYSVLFIVPVVGFLTYHLQNGARQLKALLLLSIILLILGAYSGSLAFQDITQSDFPYVFSFSFAMFIFMFIGLPFLQSYFRSESYRPSYSDLYEFGWLNTQVFITASLFTGLFWAVLALWAALFDLLNITFFTDLFFDRYFAFPATGMMVSYGVSLGLERFSISTIQRTDFLFRVLSLLLSFLVLLFLFALLVSGWEPLFQTRLATVLLLWLQLLLILFVNGLYQQGYHERSEAPLVRWAVSLSLLVMPLFSALSVYAVYLRVAQYGWTVDRVWAAIFVIIVAMYALGYAWSAARSFFNRGVWLEKLAPTNVIVAGIILLTVVATHSPLLSPLKIAGHSQVMRLLEGKVEIEQFDFKYLRFDLGQVGVDALTMLSKIEDHPQADVIRKKAIVTLALKQRWGNPNSADISSIEQMFTLYPKGQRWDDALKKSIYEKRKQWPVTSCFSGDNCKLLFVDLNQDTHVEVVLYVRNRPQMLLQKKGSIWEVVGRFNNAMSKLRQPIDFEKSNVVSSADHEWKRLRIGDTYWTVLPDKP
jgi:hypothetical protein